MHGLINRTIQLFVQNTYGPEIWEQVTVAAGMDFIDFEAMLSYDDELTPQLLDSLSAILGRKRSDVMEDIGTFIVANPEFEAVRRLMRFSGDDFVDFLNSLDDLDERARLAVPGLELPKVELSAMGAGRFGLTCEPQICGYSHVLVGLLRVMADDYGALVYLEHEGKAGKVEHLAVTLVESQFAEGRDFRLGAQAL